MIFLLNSCAGGSGEENQTQNLCEVKTPDNLPWQQVFFDMVHSNSYCKDYVVCTQDEDKYGNTIWTPMFRIHNFTVENYDEMKLFTNWVSYCENSSFKTGVNSFTWTLEDIKLTNQ